MITQQRLKELLRYYPEAGNLVWIQSRGTQKEGSLAGTVNKGYLLIKIDGKKYAAHRLAFLYQTGSIPGCDVDHIDGNKLNNSWVNLREATRQQNAQNAKVNILNAIGVKGVRCLKDTKRYQVRICNKSYGCYDDLELAEFVAQEVRRKLHGEYARHV